MALAFLWLAAICLALKFIVFPVLRSLAWKVSVISDPYVQRHPGQHTPGWALWGETPGFDARGWYMFATHTPMYIFKMVYALVLFPPALARLYFVSDHANKIPDSAVLEYLRNSSICILTKFEDNGRKYVLELGPKHKTPTEFPQVGNCDIATLRLVFEWSSGKLLEATSKHGPVVGSNSKVGRNEVLLISLLNLSTGWVHPMIHVYAEKSALEIQAKRVEELEPSVHFVSSLHEGLLHGPIGPMGWMSPFKSHIGTCAEFTLNCFSHSAPLHVLDDRKLEFEMYAFVLQGRKEVFRLVRKHKLPVNAEALFMNLIMHHIDHEMVYENLSTLPLCSSDATGSLWSLWNTHCFTHLWLQHWDNPMSSDLVINNLHLPFYRDLHRALSKVNKKRADQLLVSTCF